MVFPVTALPDQWAGAAFTAAADMWARIDANLDAFPPWANVWGSTFPDGIITLTAGVVVANTDLAGTSASSLWNATTKKLTIPAGGGLWMISFHIWGGSAVSFTPIMKGLPTGRRPRVGDQVLSSGRGAMITITDRFAGGETLSFQVSGAATVAGGAGRDLVSFAQIGY